MSLVYLHGIFIYIEFTGPTFVTLLVRPIYFLRFGIVIEGRFTSRIERLIMGHSVACPTSREIAEVL